VGSVTAAHLQLSEGVRVVCQAQGVEGTCASACGILLSTLADIRVVSGNRNVSDTFYSTV